jgi:hypothetical protein
MPPPDPFASQTRTHYNNFFEYDDNIEELFEVREITPPPSPTSEIPNITLPRTRIAKIRQVLRRVTSKKKIKLEPKPEQPTDGGGRRHATLPRMTQAERDAHSAQIKAEIYGENVFFTTPNPSKLRKPDNAEPFPIPSTSPPKTKRDPNLYATEDPEPWIPPSIFQATMPDPTAFYQPEAPKAVHNTPIGKAVPFGSHPPRATTVEDVPEDYEEPELYVPPVSRNKGKQKEENPYWEQEFELPEPDLTCPLTQPSTSNSSAAFEFVPLAFDRRGIPPEDLPPPSKPVRKSKSTDTIKQKSNLKKTTQPPPPPVPPRGKYAPPPCQCGDPVCNKECVHVLTGRGVREQLGDEVMQLIVDELNKRLGPPPKLPPRELKEKESEVLAIREKEVIQVYARWAAIHIFQKLIVAIRLSLDKFRPIRQGFLMFEFQVAYPAFHLLTILGLSHFSGA